MIYALFSCLYLCVVILQSCLLLLLSVFPLVLTGTSALTVPTAVLLLTLGQGLYALQELYLPGQEVCLDAAVTALYHITVALSPGHDPHATQHPKPLVYIFTHLVRQKEEWVK